MYYIKAIIIGVSAAFMMFLIIAPLIVLDYAPFNLPPPAAFLSKIDLNIYPLPWLMHFFYGVLWSVVFYMVFGTKGTIWQGLGLGFGLWLALMLIYSPMIGWGYFGFGEAYLLDPKDPLYLAQGNAYWSLMLVTHLLYGALVGWLNPLWDQVETL